MGAKMGGGSFDDINMTPLIDIVLVVLIIMMVNIPIQVNEMGVKLPGPKPDVPPPPPEDVVEQLVLAYYEDGQVALNRKAMTQENLFFELTRRLRAVEKKNVFIDAHPLANYGAVVDLMDMAREAGAEKVGLARMKDEGPASVTSVDSGAMPFGVFPGNPSVVGAMKETDADATLQKYLGNIVVCYKQGLAEKPGMSGRVIARLTVAPDGSLMGSKITQSSLENETTDTCIEELLATFSYPPLPPDKTAIVQYPLVFSPGK
jgi:biopolymer transport protein ExbD